MSAARSFDPQPIPPATTDVRVGSVRLVFDLDRYAFYIEAGEGYSADDIAQVLGEARRLGLVELDLDDDETHELDEAIMDGKPVRIELDPVSPELRALNPLR